MAATKTRTVAHQYFIRASPRRTFDALTNPKILVQWLADQAEFSARIGGEYRLGWTGGPTHTGTVVEFQPDKLVALTWAWPGVSLRGTVLRFGVEPMEDGTLLTVRHEGFPAIDRWTELYGGAEWGWTYFALNLKSVLETGHDLRSKYDG